MDPQYREGSAVGDDQAGTPSPHEPLHQVLADLERLDGIDLNDQVAVYERLHTALAGALAGTVEQAGPGPGGR